MAVHERNAERLRRARELLAEAKDQLQGVEPIDWSWWNHWALPDAIDATETAHKRVERAERMAAAEGGKR